MSEFITIERVSDGHFRIWKKGTTTEHQTGDIGFPALCGAWCHLDTISDRQAELDRVMDIAEKCGL